MEKYMIPVTVIRQGSGEYDLDGKRTGQSTHTVDGALFDPGSSTNVTDRDRTPENQPRLFFKSPLIDLLNGDVVTFTSFGITYTFTVTGDPLRYPLGTEVELGHD